MNKGPHTLLLLLLAFAAALLLAACLPADDPLAVDTTALNDEGRAAFATASAGTSVSVNDGGPSVIVYGDVLAGYRVSIETKRTMTPGYEPQVHFIVHWLQDDPDPAAQAVATVQELQDLAP